ncbi:MAG: hypothetical protein ABIA63_09845, partial [bacterium]
SAVVTWTAAGQAEIYVNGVRIKGDSTQYDQPWFYAKKYDVGALMREGDNSLAIKVIHTNQKAYGLYVTFTFTYANTVFLPQLPSRQAPLSIEEFNKSEFDFTEIKNFSFKENSQEEK